MCGARLYILREISLHLGEFPRRCWHIIFAFQGWLFTKGLTVDPEGCTKKLQETGILRTTPTLIPHSVYKFSYHFISVKTSIIINVKMTKISIQ